MHVYTLETGTRLAINLLLLFVSRYLSYWLIDLLLIDGHPRFIARQKGRRRDLLKFSPRDKFFLNGSESSSLQEGGKIKEE